MATAGTVPIVTACDEKYLPGLKALYNSYLRNSAEGFEFIAMLEGSPEFCATVRRELGIRTIDNPALPLKRLTAFHGRVVPALYYRFLVPDWFQDVPRSIYLDCDTLILRSLDPLATFDFTTPVAGIVHTTPEGEDVPLREEIHNVDSARREERGLRSGLLVFNHDEWRAREILSKCIAASATSLSFRCPDQSLLRYALGPSWTALPDHWQVLAGRSPEGLPVEDILVLHFMGTKPWNELPPDLLPAPDHKLQARELWKSYA